jgi:ribosomal protein L40E
VSFPFEYKSRFTSFEYADFKFSQSKFFLLRDKFDRKFSLNNKRRDAFSFSFDKVFGFLSFSVTIKYVRSNLIYTIDMVPALVLVLAIVFVSMFLTKSSIMVSMIIGAVALFLVYILCLLVVNGMVRREIESFVQKEMERIEKSVHNPVCVKCGSELPPHAKSCMVCGSADDDENTSNNTVNNLNVKYTFNTNSNNNNNNNNNNKQ